MKPKFTVETKERSGFYTMPDYELHDYYEIYYLVSGKRQYFIHDQTYDVEPGNLVFIPPEMLHQTLDSEKPNHHRILIQFSTAILGRWHDRLERLLYPFHQSMKVLRLSIQEQQYIEPTLHQLENEKNSNASDANLYAETLLVQLLIWSGRIYHHRKAEIEASQQGLVHAKIGDYVQYLHDHYQEPITLQDISTYFYVSPSHFSRTFHRYTGFQFIEFLQILRVKEAQRLLKTTSDKVVHIANHVGFGNLSHFQKVFKKRTGMSPLQYRKNHAP